MTTQQLLYAGHCYFSVQSPTGSVYHYCIRYNATNCNYDILASINKIVNNGRKRLTIIGQTDTHVVTWNHLAHQISTEIITTFLEVIHNRIEPTFAKRCCICGAVMGKHAHDHISPQCKKKLETRRYNIVNKIM